MFKNLAKGLLAGVALKLLDMSRRLSINLIKIEATKCYVHGVQAARTGVLGLLLMGLVIGLISIGVLLFHAGLFVLLPWSIEAKAILGMLLGLAYVAIGYFVLRAALDEGTWMEKSGAAKLLEKAMKQPERS